jgi:hypothetical protein
MRRKRLALLAALPLLLAVQPSGAQGPSSAAPVIEAPAR